MARKAATAAAPRYDVHPGVAMVQKWVAELPAKTGRTRPVVHHRPAEPLWVAELPAKTGLTLEQWAGLVKKSKLTTAEKRDWLKREHGHGTNNTSQFKPADRCSFSTS
jgi:hypothetical protein